VTDVVTFHVAYRSLPTRCRAYVVQAYAQVMVSAASTPLTVCRQPWLRISMLVPLSRFSPNRVQRRHSVVQEDEQKAGSSVDGGFAPFPIPGQNGLSMYTRSTSFKLRSG
jgi:hypothetical protein